MLCLQLALPPSIAYAMRPAAPTQGSGLEELERSLRSGAPQPRRQFISQLAKSLTVFGVAAFLGACDRRPPAPASTSPAPTTPPTLAPPAPPPIPPTAIGQMVVLMDRLAKTAGNRDAPDRLLRLVFGAAEPSSWRATGSEGKRAIAQRLLEARVTPQQLWARVAEAVAANNGHAALDAGRIARFLDELNTRPYDGMFQVWRGRLDIIVPSELVIAILLKETGRFDATAKVRHDGHGLMQVNRTTLLDKEFWALLQRHQLVAAPFDPKLSPAEVEQILFDPTTNVLVGILYLRELMARLVARIPDPQERVKFLLMMYNTGPGWTLGFYDDRMRGAPVGGALQTAAHYQIPPAYEEILSRGIQWPPAPPPPAKGSKRRTPPQMKRHFIPAYLIPTETLLDGKRIWAQMPTQTYLTGVDYTRTGWATFQTLLQLTHPITPTHAGLEEPGRGISRRGFLTATGLATAWLGLRGIPVLSAPPTVTPQDSDRNRFTLGRHAFVVDSNGVARLDLIEFNTSYSEVYASLSGVVALRMHDGILYAVMASSGEIRLFNNLTTGDAHEDYRTLGGAKGQTYLKPLGTIRPPSGEPGSRQYRDIVFSGATAYVTSVASLDGGPRTWRLDAYSIQNPAQPVLLWQRVLAPPGTALDGPAVGALAMVGDGYLAVSLGDRQGIALYRADRPAAPVATLPLTDVATMIARGTQLYVGQTGGDQELARVAAWDFETPTAPRRAGEMVLDGARVLRDLGADDAAQDPFLYIAVDHRLLIYETQGPQIILRGQWTFEGEASQVNVRDGVAYVVERFADETRRLHVLSVALPAEPALTFSQDLWTYRVLLTSPDGQTVVYEDRRHGGIAPYFDYQQRAGSSYGTLPFHESLPNLIPQFQDNRTVTFLAENPRTHDGIAFFLFTRQSDSVFYTIVPLWDRNGHRWTVFDRDADGRPVIVHRAFIPDLTAKNPRSVGIVYSLLDPATGRARPGTETSVLLTFDPPQAGLEELRVATARPWEGPSGRVVGQVQAIYSSTGALVGRAVLPDLQRVRLVSAWNDAVERDDFPRWQNPTGRQDSEERARLQRSGFSLGEWKRRTANPSDGLEGAPRVYLSNSLQSNFYHPWGFLIADGQVVRQQYARTRYPLDKTWLRSQGYDDALWAFVLDPGPPRIVALRFWGDQPAQELTEARVAGNRLEASHPRPAQVRHAIVGVPLILRGQDVSGLVRSGWRGTMATRDLRPNEVNWDPATTRAAFSAIGTTADGEPLLLTVTEPLLITEFTQLGRRLGAANLTLLGGSADVQQEIEGEAPLIATARTDSSRPGEIGRPLNAVLVGYELPATGLEEPAPVFVAPGELQGAWFSRVDPGSDWYDLTIAQERDNLSAMLHHLAIPSRATVVNVGSGTRPIPSLNSEWRIVNLDPAPKAVEASRQRQASHIAVDVATALTNGTFDTRRPETLPEVVVLNEIGIFINDLNPTARTQFWRDVWQVVRPGGWLVFMSPNLERPTRLPPLRDTYQQLRSEASAVPAAVLVVSPTGAFDQANIIAVQKPGVSPVGHRAQPLAPPQGGLEELGETHREPFLRDRTFRLLPGMHPPDEVTTQLFLRLILRHPERFRGKRVLELGMGSGVLTAALVQAGATVVAVDVSDDAMAIARENLQPELQEIPGRLRMGHSDLYEALPTITGDAAPRFDAVVFNHPGDVEEDFTVIYRAVAGLPSVLKPNGSAYFWAYAKGKGTQIRDWMAASRDGWVFGKLSQAAKNSNLAILSTGVVALLTFQSTDGRPDRPIDMAVFELRSPVNAGSEERVLAQLAEAAQGPGVVVIETEALGQRAGLEELVSRLPAALGPRVVLYGSPEVLRTRAWGNGVTLIPRADGVSGLAAALLGRGPAADRVTVVGETDTATTLRRLLPPSMDVTHRDPTTGLEEILRAVGVPADILRQLDLRIFDGTNTLREAA